MATACLERGRYSVEVPRPVPETSGLVRQWATGARTGGLVAGFDFPLGLPRHYAAQCGVTHFRDFIGELSTPKWSDFFQVAECEADISRHRPFFPARAGTKGTVRQAMLCGGLGASHMHQLLRACDAQTDTRPAAECMFWTLGPKQVGKAMLSGWRELLLPAVLGPERELFRLWPFDGDLPDLVSPGRAVLLEAYPAELYGHFNVRGNAKRLQVFRREVSAQMLTWAREVDVQLSSELVAQLEDGFGPGPAPEDAFDATVGLFGMLNVLLGHRASGYPAQPGVRELEGWILSRPA